MSEYNELLQKSIFKNIQSMVVECNQNNKSNQNNQNEIVKLNIGCGPCMFAHDGWTNYDHANFDQFINFIKTLPSDAKSLKFMEELRDYAKAGGELKIIPHDLTKGFPQHSDNSVHLIYLGQVIEHINPIFQAPELIKECYRMLKPGGVMRLTTPDLDLLVHAYINGEMDKFACEQPDFYKDRDPSAQLAMLMYGSSGASCVFNNYEGHMFLYTKTSMNKLLKDAGFEKIIYYNKTGESVSEVLKKEVLDFGMTHSLCLEVIK
jgi:SAM-dependent methyltransferase